MLKALIAGYFSRLRIQRHLVVSAFAAVFVAIAAGCFGGDDKARQDETPAPKDPQPVITQPADPIDVSSTPTAVTSPELVAEPTTGQPATASGTFIPTTAYSGRQFSLSRYGFVNAFAVIGPTTVQPSGLPPLDSISEFYNPEQPSKDRWTLVAKNIPEIEVRFDSLSRTQPTLAPYSDPVIYLACDWLVRGDQPRGFFAMLFCPATIYLDGNETLRVDVLDRPLSEKRAFENLAPGVHRLLIALRASPFDPKYNRIVFQIINGGNLPPSTGNEIGLPANAVSIDDVFGRLLLCQPLSRSPYIDSTGMIPLVSGFYGLAPIDAVPLTFSVETIDGAVLSRSEPRLPVDIQTAPFQTSVKAPESPADGSDFRSQVRYVFSRLDKTVQQGEFAFHNSASIRQHSDRVGAALQASSHRSRADGLLALLHANKELETDGTLDAASAKIDEIVERIASARAILDTPPDTDIFDGRTGFIERAYLSPVDDSVQPYQIYIPDSYASQPTKQYPLLVFFHGYSTTLTRTGWSKETETFRTIAQSADCIVVVPYARSNTDYLNVGERDVLDVMSEVKARYRIDDDRLFVSGYSMGGSGVYTMVAHYPEHWAGYIACAGRTDYWLWHEPSRDRTPVWQKVSILCDNPIDQLVNFNGLPSLIYHGDLDYAVTINHSERFASEMKKIGQPVGFHRINGGDHYAAWLKLSDPVSINLIRSKRRSAPTQYVRRAWSKKFMNQDDGLRFSGIRDVTEPMDVDVRYDAQRNTITVSKLNNLDWMLINPISRLGVPAAKEKPALLQADGLNARLSWQADGQLFVSLSGTSVPPRSDWSSPVKEGRWAGPVREIMTEPWVIVRGTLGNDESDAASLKEAERLRTEWLDFAQGEIDIIEDTHAADDPRGLFLLGGPQTNAYVRAVADTLPVRWSDDSRTVTVGSMSVELTDGRGLVFCYPDMLHAKKLQSSISTSDDGRTVDGAENMKRLLVIQQGEFWGAGLSINHKWDLVPDLIIYERETETTATQPTNRALVTAFFDYDWRVDPKTTWNQDQSKIR